mgnify:CR=1 FL=1
MPSIEEQYNTAAKKCRSYSYCTGCSIQIPKPTLSEACAENPLACIEKESTQHMQNLPTYKEKAFTTSEMEALQREARGEIPEFKEYFYTGNNNTLTVTKENFEDAVKQFCSDAKAVAASDRASNWCKEQMVVFSELERSQNITQKQQVRTATDFEKQRQQSIDKYLEGKNSKVYDPEKRRWVLQ